MKTVDILVQHGQNDSYYLVDTPERLKAALQCLFKQFDEQHCYGYVTQSLLARARTGHIESIRRILESHRGHEYEGWAIVEAIIPDEIVDSLDDYQTEAYKTAVYPDNLSLIYPALGLAGEAGETANKIKKIYRDDNSVLTPERKVEIAKELGGVLWYVAAIATDAGLQLSEIATANLDILRSRQERGTLHGSGDDR